MKFIVFIAKDPTSKQLIISYRGTVRSSFKNILTDAQFILKPYPPAASQDVKVHSGFYDAFLEARDDIRNEVANFMKSNPDFNVFLTGHSLGGGKINF